MRTSIWVGNLTGINNWENGNEEWSVVILELRFECVNVINLTEIVV